MTLTVRWKIKKWDAPLVGNERDTFVAGDEDL